jgi:hypothetical protein
VNGSPRGSLRARVPATRAIRRQLDLVVLAVALPVFLIGGFPVIGYTAACGAWLAQRAVQFRAARHAAAMLTAGDRKSALATTAFATLGRLWLLTLSILLAGKLAEREDGLAAAVLAAVLVTAYLSVQALSHVRDPSDPSPPSPSGLGSGNNMVNP